MQKLNFDGDLDLVEGTMHSPLFITGVGNIESTIRPDANQKVISMKLVNNGSLVQLTLKNPKDPKRPFVELVHMVNFTGVTVKTHVNLELVKA
jgi:hypothetical protein